MKRIKRFVLAHSTEKDPNWKSSDNLLARISKNDMAKNDGVEENVSESRAELTTSTSLT